MRIYADIKRAGKNMHKDPVLQRLALACAMVHAVPVQQSNPEEQTNAPPLVNPVKRYLHFEKAFLDGELPVAHPVGLALLEVARAGLGEDARCARYSLS